MRRPTTPRRRRHLSNEHVLAVYTDLRAQGLLNKQIARRLGLTVDALDYHLRKGRAAGDRRAAPLHDQPARAAAVDQLTRQGRPAADIAEQLGVHERTVVRIRARLRQQGVAA